ncbi:hypothetical protein [Virgibacillus sp. MG-45]|uniref:hypothetical protein n=1 Tax=Virgibacillus sp. MG-45 TaxID=3102791 RepID=UPI002ED93CDC
MSGEDSINQIKGLTDNLVKLHVSNVLQREQLNKVTEDQKQQVNQIVEDLSKQVQQYLKEGKKIEEN